VTGYATRTDAYGSYSTVAEAGPGNIYVSHADYIPNTLSVDIPVGGRITHDIHLTPKRGY